MLPTPTLKTNNKLLDALAVAMHPQTRLMVYEGTVRAIKTVTAILAFHYRVQKSGAKFHLIAGRNLDTIRRNIMQAELGLITMFPDKYEEAKDKYGGVYVRCKSSNGTKEIIICGYSDKTRWENITGGSIENILLDEANLADEQFLNECFARQIAALNPWTCFTLNGDDPQHFVYQNYVNRCRIIGRCPASTKADMDKSEKARGYRYMFFTFRDNPIMSKEMCESAEAIYPKGSYYYKTRILGERGSWGVMIYADYMNPSDLLVDVNEKLPNGKAKFEISSYAIGGDVAENKAYNVYALLGFDREHTQCYVVDLLIFKSTSTTGQKNGYKYKTEMLKGFLFKHNDKNLEYIAIDSAEGNYINDLKGQADQLGVRASIIIGSYKATIKERIDMNIVLFSGKRMFFNIKTALPGFQAFQASKWAEGKEGKEREDLGTMINDIMDAIEYAETPYMSALTFGKGRERK